MKKVILFAILFITAFSAFSQDSDSSKPRKQPDYIPPFKIIREDSSWYYKGDLSTKKPTLILYFSPDCGHCQLETEDMIAKMRNLQNLQIVMVTSRPYDDMVNFVKHYKLSNFANLKVGTDPEKLVTRFYDVKFTPFSALYNKKGKLLKVYEQGIDWDELIALIK